MKMKSLVIAMSLLAAASTSVWADQAGMDQAGATQQAAGQATIDKLNQVFNQYNSDLGGMDWTKVLSVHGGMYTDGHWGTTNEGTSGVNNDRFSVTNAYLALQATPNEWSKMNVVMNYSDTSDTYARTTGTTGDSNDVFVDQAYATFGDLDKYPVFVQLGKQYVPFGSYELYPVVQPMTQVLSMTNRTEGQVGYVGKNGTFASFYTFQNDVSQDRASAEPETNYGVTLGSQKHNDRFDLDFGVGYMNDMAGVDVVDQYIGDNLGYYNNTVHAANGYVKYHTGPFGISAQYVTATDHFDDTVVPYEVTSSDGEGAKPWASDVQVSYDFMAKNMRSQVLAGYQKSGQASALGLPENRYVVGYNVFPWKNTMIGLEATRDTNYDSDYETWDGSAGDGENYYTYAVRVGVKF